MVFKPGESGNPGGRPGAKLKLQAEKLLPYVDKAVEKIVEGLTCGDDSIQLRSAVEIMDRVFGKATQAHDLGEAGDNIINVILRAVTPKTDGD